MKKHMFVCLFVGMCARVRVRLLNDSNKKIVSKQFFYNNIATEINSINNFSLNFDVKVIIKI